MGSKISFFQWLTSFTSKDLAEKLGVSVHSINRYKRGEMAPQTDRILKLEKLSKGKFSCEEIYKYCSENRL